MDHDLFVAPTRDEWELLLRLLVAALAGGVIGWNRHRRGKPAGVGTHSIVALGAALFASIPALAGASHDAVSRVIQGVATGVGFLGAGEIFRSADGARVSGLTSAASVWVTAALGLVIACGSLFMSIAATLLVLLVLDLAPRIEGRIH